MDEVQVAFTHSPAGSHARLAENLPIITAEETPWGMLRYGKRASGGVLPSHHLTQSTQCRPGTYA
jgi:membrane-associated PAP2 superfamily phosphatase